MAKLNLSQLRAAGSVSREPIKREVTWERPGDDGETLSDTFDVWVIRSSIGTELAIHKEAEKDREYVLTALSKRVMLENEKGKQILLPYDEWAAFDATLALAIFKVMREVSEPPKVSAPPKSFSASLLPAESVAEA